MIETSSWYATGSTVWTHTAHGETLVADCTNRNVPVSIQRLNARLCTAAPAMLELLESIDYLEPDHFNALLSIRKYVHQG